MLIQQLLPIIQQRLATLPSNANLSQAAKLLSFKHINLVVICDANDKMVGVITDSDVVLGVAKCGVVRDACRLSVADALTKEVVSCRIDDQLETAWKTMSARNLRHLPVIDREGKPVGVLYARDALKSLLEEVQNDDVLIRDYILGFYH